MKVLKICFFVPFFPIIKGGAEYQSKIIAEELKKNGHDIIFISQGFKSDEILFKDGFKIYGVDINPRLKEKAFLYRSFAKIFQDILEKENPDTLYQRILNTFSFRIAGITNRLNIPYVLHIADNYSVEFTGIKGVLKKILFLNIVKDEPTIICQTQYQYLKIKNLIGKLKVLVIPNMHPVLMRELQTKKKNEILWIGNARPVKQLELFIELALKYKNTDYVFNIIGNLPQSEYGKKLQSRIIKSENIKYFGEKENDFINDKLAKASLLINTSVSEGFSNTFIQAWMSGTPVFSLNSDPDGVIKKYNLGLNCEGSKTVLFSEMESILDSKEYLKICFNILKTSNKLFSLKNNAGKLESLFLILKNE